MLNILYEDDELIVVVKPAGVESQETKSSRPDMVSEIKKHLKRNGAKELYVGVVHRLDCPVSGIMVYAKTAQAAAKLSAQIAKQGHMDKEYMAIVTGEPEQSAELICRMDFDRKSNTSFVVEGQAGKQAKLTYELLEQIEDDWGIFAAQQLILRGCELIKDKKLSLLKIKLYTGRHHQIRLQLKEAGLPIVGDTKYSEAFKDYRGKPALCLISSGLTFKHPKTGKTLSFKL